MNQPPQSEKQMGKRIVSKGEYGFIIVRKTLLGLGSFGLFCVTTISFTASIVLFMVGCFGVDTILNWGAALLVGIFGYVLIRLANIGMDKALKEKVLPLTRANTANLPALYSLVRASAEPVEEQEAVLLRAATADVEKHEEQLVRATAGTE